MHCAVVDWLILKGRALFSDGSGRTGVLVIFVGVNTQVVPRDRGTVPWRTVRVMGTRAAATVRGPRTVWGAESRGIGL